jgi:hypothetical protein
VFWGILVWDHAVSWFEYQAEMMCDFLLSRDGPCDLGAVKKKGMITSLPLLVCWDDKIL